MCYLSMMRKAAFRIFTGFLLVIFMLPSAGADEDDWVLAVPAPAVPGVSASPGNSPADSQWQKFYEKLRTDVFDDVCRNIKLPLSQKLLPIEYLGADIEVERSLATYPNKQIMIVDRSKLSLSLGLTQALTDKFSLTLEGRADGEAYVIRPLEGTNACSEVKTLLNILKFETVVPLADDRLEKMKVGEIWKFPLTLNAGIVPSASVSSGLTTFTLSMGYSQGSGASVMLMRLADNALGLRLRFDDFNLKTGGASIKVATPEADFFGLDGGSGLIQKQFDKLLLKELNRYITTALDFNSWKRDGRKVFLEFIVDPSDQLQRDHLTEFLKGNINSLAVLRRIVKATKDTDIRHGEVSEHLAELEKRRAEALSAPSSFAAASDYQRSNPHNFHLQIPFLADLESRKETQDDSIVSGTKDFVTDIHQSFTYKSSGVLDVPWLKKIFKNTSQKTVRSMTRVDFNGMPDKDATFLTYIQQDGFVRGHESSARKMVVSANEILRLAGTRGEGESRALLPVETMFPKREPPASIDDMRHAPTAHDSPPMVYSPLYRSAVSAFTLIFNQKAIEDILWADVEIVTKAFRRTLSAPDKDRLSIALADGNIAKDGTLTLNQGAIRREIWRARISDRRGDPYWDIVGVAKAAAGMVQDLADIRRVEGGWQKRAAALVELISQGGRSGRAYDDALKVLIQLTDTKHIFGEFRMETNKRINGEKDVSVRYLLHSAVQNDAYSEQLKLEQRFAEPPLLGY